MPSPSVMARNELGVASRSKDTTRIQVARRNLAAAKLEQYIEKVVADAPPLTAAQRDHLARLFVPVEGYDA